MVIISGRLIVRTPVGVALVVPAQDLSTRAQLILTLVLTIVAFKMAIASKLPEVSYLTVLDKYH